MALSDITRHDLYWLDGSGAAADVVIATRVRLARNLVGHCFPHRADEEELRQVRDRVSDRVVGRPEFADGWQVDLSECSHRDRRFLMERHLASADLIRGDAPRALLLSEDLARVVMVNEEDHLRLQVFRSGFAPAEACTDALALDSGLEADLDFAFDEDLGYLTACPTNAGTGLRLSVLVHLPGLVLSNEIERILNSLRQLRFTVRGLFGEGSAVRGALFQISNLCTLGRSEDTLTRDFVHHVTKVLQFEKMARERLLERDPDGCRDLVYRSLGVLGNAHLMTSREAFDRLSNVRLGVNLELLPPIPLGVLNRALVEVRAAHLQIRAGQLIKGRTRSALRATYLRELFADFPY